MRELSPLSIILGILIGILFGAANAYIGLKVGMTVSASIPAAVISMAILRGVLRRGSLGENNMVQTIGSVGESLAAGMIFTIPALFVFAYTENNPDMAPSIAEMTLWGGIGGLLGVLFMVPLRRLLIVREHGKLPYPEGTACAEVLQSGQQGGAGARAVFAGLGVGAIYEFVRGLGFWREEATQRLPLLKTEFGLKVEPALLGVGYILGIRIAGYMLAGAVLGWFVIIPAISFFGANVTEPIFPAAQPIAQMEPFDIWNRYLRYIGAGAVVLGGLVSLFKSFGTIGTSLFHMVAGRKTTERTDRDIPLPILLLLFAAVGAAMWFAPQYGLAHDFLRQIPVIACVLVFGFFFVTVSSRLVGVVGGSSNPASGMTIATLLGTALLVVMLGDQIGLDLSPTQQKMAIISVGALVCIAICIAGDCSQDLKTGYLVKATPWKQQFGEIIGVITAAGALAAVIWLCNDRYGFFQDEAHPNALLSPQANLMKLLVQGVVDQELPWPLILTGMAAALVVELLGIPSLPFAVGLYLPLSLSTPIMAGGLVRWFVDRTRKAPTSSEAHDPGVLTSSGLVAGQGLVGVFFVGVAALIGWLWNDPRFEPPVVQPDGTVLVAEAPESAPATAPVTPTGELVVPAHFYPWLSTQFDWLHPEYGLTRYRYESGAFEGEYAVDWYKLLPLVPFGLMLLWLLWVALQRPAAPPPEPEAATTDPLAPSSTVPDSESEGLRESGPP
jgi:putative OPT family oligopeptide transporter